MQTSLVQGTYPLGIFPLRFRTVHLPVLGLYRFPEVPAGGSLLVVADTLARTLIAPLQLPVGALMALIGVPLFLFLIKKQF